MSPPISHFLIASASAFVLGCTTHAADRALFDSQSKPNPAKIETRDAKISEPGDGYLLKMDTGTTQKWPGITLPATDGPWDLSASSRVTVKLKNAGASEALVTCRVDNPGADGVNNCVNGNLRLVPGATGTLDVVLTRAGDNLGGKLFGMMGYPAGSGAGKESVDSKNVVAILLFVQNPETTHTIEIGDIRATGGPFKRTASVTDASPFFPFVDTFGQYNHKDWPGKVMSLDDLTSRRDTEAKDLAANPRPAGWDKYGGWSDGPHHAATGFFRTEKQDGKWWLVDPDGNLFYSQGIDCVRVGDNTPVEERQSWFADFPGDKPEFKQFLASVQPLLGYYAGRTVQCFSFVSANLLRKYGPAWQAEYASLAHRRLRSWGLNTIGNWSDPATRLMNQTPYVDTIGSHGSKLIAGSSGYWGKFDDVFDPTFADSVKASMAAKAGKTAGDPWCIGFFSDNEMSWGSDTSLGLATLQSPPDQPAKKEFLAELKGKYGDTAKLNAVWGTSYATWDALLASRDIPDKTKAKADLAAFYQKLAETYFKTNRDAVRSVAPHQLYLGCRFASSNDIAAIAAAKYCDVVSYNLYRRSVANFHFPGGDKPLLIGEFHFGALDRGLFHPGLGPVADQQERAQAYTDYVMGAVRHPLIVGTHWFQWVDEPLTGRSHDGENYQIGFLDVADTPYPEMIQATRTIAAQLYQTRSAR
jgi:hypothetical protein